MRDLILPIIALIAIGGCSQPAESATTASVSAEGQTTARAARLQSPEARALAARIEAEGAEAVFTDLIGPPDHNGLDPVFAGIATGAPEWLALVPQLQPWTDGEYAEGMDIALAQALPVNPKGVLALIPDHGSYYFVCADADIPTARPVVAAITDTPLRAARDRCLRYMDADEAELETLEAE